MKDKMPAMVDLIKQEMREWYSIKLTDEQILEYINDYKLEYFDTAEREDFANIIAQRVAGMNWPHNGSSQVYKCVFYDKWIMNSKSLGYTTDEECPDDTMVIEDDNFWNDKKVIDFVNWYLEVCNISDNHQLENMTIIESFKNGDDPDVWNSVTKFG